MDAANILKPALARGAIRVIGATTIREYRQTIEKDGAPERRFQAVRIEEPSADEAVAILLALRPRLKAHHGVALEEAALRARLKKPGRPVGLFLFVGPSGTGKTELAKALADNLFHDERRLIRFDMSEFMEEHSVAKLILREGFSVEYGARNLERVVNQMLGTLMAEALLGGKITAGQAILLVVFEGRIQFCNLQ